MTRQAPSNPARPPRGRRTTIAIGFGVAALAISIGALAVALLRTSGVDESACRRQAWNAVPTSDAVPDGWSLSATSFNADGYSASFSGPAPADGTTDPPGVFVRVSCYGNDGSEAMRLSHASAVAAGADDAQFAALGDESFAVQDPVGGSTELYIRRGLLVAYVAGSGPVDQDSLEQLAVVVDDAIAASAKGPRPAPSPGQVRSPRPTGSPATSVPAGSSSPAGALETEDPVPAESDAPRHDAPALEALLPKSVNGTAFTSESITGSDALGDDPSSQALAASLTKLGKAPADLKIAQAADPAGNLDLGIIAFQVKDLDGALLRQAILDSWFAVADYGMQSSSITLGGKSVTKVSYGDEGANDYLYAHGDVVYYLASADEALVTTVLSTLP